MDMEISQNILWRWNMARKVCLFLIITLVFSVFPPSSVHAESIPDFCEDGVHAGGAEYIICVPDNWQGDLIVYAHGYVAFNEPIGIPWDQLIFPDGTSIPEIMTSLGFAFATTSYSTNGLAVEEGLAEIIDLVSVFKTLYPEPNIVLLGGVSEGGLITALAIEQHPETFDGGLSTCGPIGDFREQINYWGDFRIVFDYLFPGVLPPSPMDIPPELIEDWETVYLPAIIEEIQGNPFKTAQLLNITKAPFDHNDLNTIQQTVEKQLWYNAFATNDGIEKLGGQPFDNMDRVYSGLTRSRLLNRRVERFSADQTALDNIESNYQTSGNLTVPLVTVHTTGDEVVPYWHESLYRQKVLNNHASSLYTHIPIARYGHCNFNVIEILAGFGILLLNVTGQQMEGVESVLHSPEAFNSYLTITQTYSASP
jgi:pimeloyl-ACP methyl ester carboxylesterase